MTATRLVLVRHGQTAWHEENRYTGSTDLPLDETGFQQANALVPGIRKLAPDVIYTSTMLRARQTFKPAAESLGLEPETDIRLRELAFGWAEGRTLSEMRKEDPDLVAGFIADPVASPLPSSEPLHEGAHRAVSALQEIAEISRGGTALVIGHSTIIRLALCHWLGIPLSRYRTSMTGMEPRYAAQVTYGGTDQVILEYYNRPLVGSEGFDGE